MDGEPDSGPAADQPGSQGARERVDHLRTAVGRAIGRARALVAATGRRRTGTVAFRDQVAVWRETSRTLREMEELERELREEDEGLAAELARETEWARGQVAAMIEAGWTRAELADVGVGDDELERLGLFREPGPGPG